MRAIIDVTSRRPLVSLAVQKLGVALTAFYNLFETAACTGLRVCHLGDPLLVPSPLPAVGVRNGQICGGFLLQLHARGRNVRVSKRFGGMAGAHVVKECP